MPVAVTQPALFLSMPPFLSEQLSCLEGRVTVAGLRGSCPALVSALATTGPCCCILPDEQLVGLFEQDLRLFTDAPIFVYPGYEIPPYTPLSPDQQTTATRISTLYALNDNHGRFFVVASMEALMRRTMPKRVLSGNAELVMAGEDFDQQKLIEVLVHAGYEKVSLVQRVGDFSLRGGIIDIFPPPFPDGHGNVQDGPIRLDFFGDFIDSIRLFDPLTQRSERELAEATLLPVSDILFPPAKSPRKHTLISSLHEMSEALNWDSIQTSKVREHIVDGRRFAGIELFLPLFYRDALPHTATVFDFLPEETRIVVIDTEACRQTLQIVSERIGVNHAESQRSAGCALPPELLFLDEEQLDRHLAAFSMVQCSDFSGEPETTLTLTSSNHRLLKQDISAQRQQRGLLAPLSDQILSWQKQGDIVVICCRTQRHAKNLAELLEKHGHDIAILEPPLLIDILQRDGNPHRLHICSHPLQEGFSLPEYNIHLLSESELFGEMRLGGRKKTHRPQADPVRFAELNQGDVVVHRDHGLGIYHGLSTIEFNGVCNDFVLIEYRDGDRLYLPVDRLNLISRYQGLSDHIPKIDKLGAQSWKTVKTRVKEEVWKIAQDLLDLYAKREIREGRRFSPPAELFHELEESFPYDETPGQDKAITDVIGDLASDKPMDRLVCGDVGYGKTEVAVRAAFKVVEDGFQVAILVPTTVLAEQHMHTFKERLQGFPVTVECINRFRKPATQRRILRELATGRIDIIIGTHRLLSKDVVYKNLGLLIIDEEHRFGVGHKEKIKRIKAEVDILTLTATPIPRTLQMSLLGIRDLSVISSPPINRLPVKTFVARYDDLVIKEAVVRELRRNGQVFFVHNRVRSIHRIAATIQKLVPTARIGIANGQMEGRELEAVMVLFVNKEIDVLVCTTIIESGLDIPAANTIIINQADRLGLAEIYQLRGRVGRSTIQSYAYLLVPSMDGLSKESKERLRALMDYSELGGGFKLAMSDLQIRGGGNLLGVSQSGHIAAIGYDLYLDLLQKTVTDLKNRIAAGDSNIPADDLDPEINLQISAYIPQGYIPDTSQRYLAYRRISTLSTADDSAHTDLLEEMRDRYGSLPQETVNLFAVVALKRDLIALRIARLEKGKNNLVLTFQDDTPVRIERLLSYLQTRSDTRLTPEGRLIVQTQTDTADKLFAVIRQTLTELTTLCQ